MFQSKWEIGLQGKEALALRRAVLVEEKGMDEKTVFDRNDEYAAHAYVWSGDEPIAAGRIFPLGTATGIGSIVSAPAYRKQPFEDLVLRILLDKAQTLAGDPIIARLRADEVPLYTPFGFEKTQDNEDGTATYTVPRDGIRWHSDCGGHDH